jgi:hypothetical protein
VGMTPDLLLLRAFDNDERCWQESRATWALL